MQCVELFPIKVPQRRKQKNEKGVERIYVKLTRRPGRDRRLRTEAGVSTTRVYTAAMTIAIAATGIWTLTICMTSTLMILTGTLERNGLKEAGAELIRKLKGLSTGMLMAVWGVAHELFIIFKIPGL